MISSRDLKRAYLRFNKEFFGGRLPKDAEVSFKALQNEDGRCMPSIETIHIDRSLAHHPNLALLVLLHECIHMDLGEEYIGVPPEWDHGIRFGAGVVRLFNAGAYDGIL